MLTETLSELFERDLLKLKGEISSYKDGSNIWKIEKQIANSAGNLVLHLCGNLKYFIGCVLGESGYVRNRDGEFSNKNLSVKELLQNIDETLSVVKQTLSKLTEADLEKIYPINVFQKEMTTSFFLISLVAHFNYHLGQVNYHRRMID